MINREGNYMCASFCPIFLLAYIKRNILKPKRNLNRNSFSKYCKGKYLQIHVCTCNIDCTVHLFIFVNIVDITSYFPLLEQLTYAVTVLGQDLRLRSFKYIREYLRHIPKTTRSIFRSRLLRTLLHRCKPFLSFTNTV